MISDEALKNFDEMIKRMKEEQLEYPEVKLLFSPFYVQELSIENAKLKLLVERYEKQVSNLQEEISDLEDEISDRNQK